MKTPANKQVEGKLKQEGEVESGRNPREDVYADRFDKMLGDALDVFGKDEPYDTVQFNQSYGAEFPKTSKPEDGRVVLHKLAEAVYDIAKFKPFMQWLLQKHPHLLERREKRSNYTPLHLALESRKNTFVSIVLEYSKDSRYLRRLFKILKVHAHYGKNCIHLAVETKSPYTDMLIDICVHCEKRLNDKRNSIFQQIENVGSVDKNTPLHLALAGDCTIQSTSQEQGKLPIQFNREQKQDVSHFSAKEPSIDSPHSERIDNSSGHPTFNKMEIVEKLVHAHVEALLCRNSKGHTPYQFRLEFLGEQVRKKAHGALDDDEFQQRLRGEVDDDSLACYIRSYCIRNLSRDMALAALYPLGQERNIDFDLSGLRNQSITMGYLDGLAMHLQFESMLRYVALPKLTVEGDGEEQNEKLNKNKGLTDLKKIFEWLRRNHVNKIVKVIVVDDGDLAHTDTAIQEALFNFDVKVWDWKKIDLCSEVVFKAAREVEEITLYSSGNNAVLLGWSSTDGLLKFPNLKVVRLCYREGLENPDDYAQAFKRKVEMNSKNRDIQVHTFRDNEANTFAARFQNNQVVLESENLWMNCIKDFAVFIRNIRAPKQPQIKIAIVDSGIDATLPMFQGKIALGKSFCSNPSSGDCISQYYVPSDSHGTKMAYFVCQVFPKAKLYIARVADDESRTGKQQFTAKSAAEALEWAIQCNVDIISMSWTIETKASESQEMVYLEKMVTEAERKGILMFCSADDRGSSSSEHCYPGQWTKCLQIGAANDTGEICHWVPAHDQQYIFPGLNIPFSGGLDIPDSLESGSSVATAIAAGFAGLLMYCDKLVFPGIGEANNGATSIDTDLAAKVDEESDSDGEEDDDDKPTGSQVSNAGPTKTLYGINSQEQTHARNSKRQDDQYYNIHKAEGMKGILRTMSEGSYANSFPRIYEYFPREFRHLSWEIEDERAFQHLQELMNVIKSKSKHSGTFRLQHIKGAW